MKYEACNQNRTGDLYLTKVTLYRLSYTSKWLREKDSNLRPSGYEPDELPTAPSRDRKMEGEGFEPSKAEPTDLQSVPFGRSGTPPNLLPTHDIIHMLYKNVNNFFQIFYFICASRFSRYCSSFRFTRCNALSTDFTCRPSCSAIST